MLPTKANARFKEYLCAGLHRLSHPLHFMLILCLLAGSVAAFANLPTESAAVALKVITGTVSGEDGEPLEAATVKIVGKPITVQTDQSGRFTVDADEGDVIEISAV